MGKARSFSTSDDDAVLQTQSDNENYAVAAQQNAQNLGSVHFSDNSGYGNFKQSGRDQRNASLEGALFRGNLGFNLQTAVLDVGTETLDILEDGSSNPLNVISVDKVVTISAGLTANLTTILGAQRPGQRLLLYGIQGNTITIKHTAAATPNTILTPDATDFNLSDTNVALLVYDITTAKWRVLSGGGSGGGGLTDPIILNENDLGTIGFLTQIIDWSTNNFYRAILNGYITITMDNLPVAGKWEQVILEFTQDGTGNHNVTFLDTFANGVVPLINTGANTKTTIIFYAYNDGSSVILSFDSSASFLSYPEFDHGNQGPGVLNIDWSVANFQRMVLQGGMLITHTNLPAPGKWQQVIVEYTQDGIGSHNVTYTQSFANGVVPLVNFAPTSKTSVVFYAYNTGVITLILAFETQSAGNTDFIHAIKAVNQPPPLTVTSHAEFDTILNSQGITVSTGAGQLSGIFSGFRAGRTYECECFIGMSDPAIPATLGYDWVDIAGGGLFIGNRGFVHTMDSPGTFQSIQPSAKAIFQPVADTDTLEVQFTSNSNLAGITMLGSMIGQPESYVVIKDIT